MTVAMQLQVIFGNTNNMHVHAVFPRPQSDGCDCILGMDRIADRGAANTCKKKHKKDWIPLGKEFGGGFGAATSKDVHVL